ATSTRVNAFGIVESPYRKVVNGKVTDQVDYLTATDEERYVIAQANAPLKDDGNFVNDRVLVRRGSGDVEYVPPKDVDYMDVSPKQPHRASAARIAFLEHDDAHRARQGS